ncbi:MAG: BspA family leucine-rich repeat surface protein [Blautia sp.]
MFSAEKWTGQKLRPSISGTKRKHRRRCLGRVGKTERQHYGLDRGKRDGFMDLYLAANGNILANKDCSKLFMEYEKLKKIVGLQYCRTDQTENMSDMFFGCMQLKRLNLKKQDTGNVTNMSNMFYLCLHLQSFESGKTAYRPGDGYVCHVCRLQ